LANLDGVLHNDHMPLDSESLGMVLGTRCRSGPKAVCRRVEGNLEEIPGMDAAGNSRQSIPGVTQLWEDATPIQTYNKDCLICLVA